MRYRGLDPVTGDMQFGLGVGPWLVNSPEAVAQAVRTRLLLIRGEWFLDKTEGTPWTTEILGVRTAGLYDKAIRSAILDTDGVSEITAYASQLVNRGLNVQATITTIYGAVTITFGLGTGGAASDAGLIGILDFSTAAQSGLITLI